MIEIDYKIRIHELLAIQIKRRGKVFPYSRKPTNTCRWSDGKIENLHLAIGTEVVDPSEIIHGDLTRNRILT